MKFKAIFLFVFLWQFDGLLSDGSYGLGRRISCSNRLNRLCRGNVVHISSGVSGLVLAILTVREKALRKEVSYRIIFRLLYSVHHFCGSVGSDLMQEVRLRQTVLHFTHLQQLTLLRLVQCFHG